MSLFEFGFLVEVSVIWNVMRCSVVHWYQHIGRIYCLLSEGKIR